MPKRRFSSKVLLWYLNREIKQLFRTTPTESGKKKMRKLARILANINFEDDDVIAYVEFVFGRLLNIKDMYKRSSVHYFIAMLANQNLLYQYMDYRKHTPKSDLQCPTKEQDTIYHKSMAYTPILNDETKTVYFAMSREKFSFIVRDYTKDPPEIMTRKKYNEENPNSPLSLRRLIRLSKAHM